MDDLSYYGTIGAVILLQISYIWFFRGDHPSRQMTRDNIADRKLAVILVNSGHRISEELKVELKEAGFIIYEICFAQNAGQISIKRNTIQLNLKLIEHNEQAVEYINTQLKLKNLKLHAYISLPAALHCNNSPYEVLKLMEEFLIPSSGLLLSFSSTIVADKAKIIRVQNASNFDIGPLKLIYSHENIINQFLRDQTSQVGQNLTEVVEIQRSMRTTSHGSGWNLRLFAGFLNYSSNQDQLVPIQVIEHPAEERMRLCHDNKVGTYSEIIEPIRNDIRLDEETVCEVIKTLVTQFHPQETIN